MIRHFVRDMESFYVGRGQFLLRSRPENVECVVSSQEAQLLHACRVPRTLQQHAEEFLRRKTDAAGQPLQRSPGEAGTESAEAAGRGAEAAVAAKLEEFVAAGLLASEEEIVGELRRTGGVRGAGARSSTPISSICIPTRNRPSCLDRALVSWMRNDVDYGRSTTFLIADDSEAPETQRRNLQVVGERAREHGRTCWYATRRLRSEYAGKLAAHAGIPEEVTRFALLGDPRCTHSFGATRNSLLLGTAGELCMQADDDMVCEVSRPPSLAAGLQLTSAGDLSEYWFFESFGDALAGVRREAVDLLALHEAVLGRGVPECIAGVAPEEPGVTIAGRLNAEFLRQARRPEAKVALSFTGLVGDSGGPNLYQWRLGLSGPSFERLVQDASRFEARLFSRQMVKCATRLTLSNGGYCAGGNFGFDNRSHLPPFVPVQVGEDAVFGQLRVLAYGAFSASVPACIVHDTSAFRSPRFEPEPSVYMMHTVLSTIIKRFFNLSPHLRGASDLASLGRYLCEVSRLPHVRFAGFVNEILTPVVSGRGHQMDRLLAERTDAPPFWRDRVLDCIQELRGLVAREDPASPSDLPGSADERQRLFQQVLHQYGELLEHWEAILHSAAQLRGAGVRPCEMV